LKRAKEEETDEAKKRELDELEERKEALKTQTDLIWEAKDDILKAVYIEKNEESIGLILAMARHELRILTSGKNESLKTLLSQNGGNFVENGSLGDHVQLLADILVFGAFGSCPACENFNFYYSADLRVYQCASAPCKFFAQNVGRVPVKSVSAAKGLAKYKKKILLPGGRVFPKLIDEKVISLKSAKKPSRKRKHKKTYGVDAYFSFGDDFHVYVDANGDPHQFLLHKVDEKDGKTRFYKMQLLQNDRKKEEGVLIRRYGIVLTGTTNDLPKKDEGAQFDFNEFASALEDFEKIFREKAGFPWVQRHVEQKKRAANDYALVEWKVDLSGTYGRASYDQDEDESAPKEKQIKE